MRVYILNHVEVPGVTFLMGVYSSEEKLREAYERLGCKADANEGHEMIVAEVDEDHTWAEENHISLD